MSDGEYDQIDAEAERPYWDAYERAMSDYDNSPHKDNIQWLLDNSIANGYPDGTYRPSEPVTRGQMATFLRNYDDYRHGVVEPEPPVVKPDPPADLTPHGSIYHALPGIYRYENLHIQGKVTASGAGVRIEIKNSIIDGDGQPYAVAGHVGSSPNDGVFLTNCTVRGGEDAFKNSVSTVDCWVGDLSRKYREDTGDTPHGDCHQMEGSAYAEHLRTRFEAYWREDGELANAAFMLKTERDNVSQTIRVTDCHMEGGNYTVFLRDDHGWGEICSAYFQNTTYTEGAWRYGLSSVTAGYGLKLWDVKGI